MQSTRLRSFALARFRRLRRAAHPAVASPGRTPLLAAFAVGALVVGALALSASATARAQPPALPPEVVEAAGEERVLAMVCAEARFRAALWDRTVEEAAAPYADAARAITTLTGEAPGWWGDGPEARAVAIAADAVCSAPSLDAAYASVAEMNAAAQVAGAALGEWFGDFYDVRAVEREQRAAADARIADLRAKWEAERAQREASLQAQAESEAAGLTSREAGDALRERYEALARSVEAEMRARAQAELDALVAEIEGDAERMRAAGAELRSALGLVQEHLGDLRMVSLPSQTLARIGVPGAADTAEAIAAVVLPVMEQEYRAAVEQIERERPAIDAMDRATGDSASADREREILDGWYEQATAEVRDAAAAGDYAGILRVVRRAGEQEEQRLRVREHYLDRMCVTYRSRVTWDRNEMRRALERNIPHRLGILEDALDQLRSLPPTPEIVELIGALERYARAVGAVDAQLRPALEQAEAALAGCDAGTGPLELVPTWDALLSQGRELRAAQAALAEGEIALGPLISAARRSVGE